MGDSGEDPISPLRTEADGRPTMLSALERDELEAFREARRNQQLAHALAPFLPPSREPKSHIKDLEKEKEFSGDNPAIQIEDWMKDIKAAFRGHRTPEEEKVSLVVSKLTGTARKRFNGFINGAGDVGDRYTTSWEEFEVWALNSSLSTDRTVEAKQLRVKLESLRQTGSCKAFVDAFSVLQARIWDNPKSRQHYTMAGMIQLFIDKTKVHVQEKLIDKEYNSLESVYRDAIARDNLIFSARMSSPTPRTGGNPLPRPAPRDPRPPAHLIALLANLGYDADGKPLAAKAADSPGLNAVDHSVGPDAPIPKMTKEIEAWCKANGACYRCRQLPKLCPQGARNCKRFGPSTNPSRRLNAVEEDHAEQHVQENDG
jgi:hypothetical protein